MNYAIVENEEIARLNLQNMIEGLRPHYNMVFTADSKRDTENWIKTNPEVDVIFLDIELNDGNCFDIPSLPQLQVPIIFTTAYDDFAIKAFKVQSVDYLLKPIVEEDLEPALLKLERLRAQHEVKSSYAPIVDTMHRRQRQRILTVSGDSYSYANIDQVSYIISIDKLVFAILTDGQKRLTNFLNMNEAASAVEDAGFFRLSRSVIASIQSIKSVHKFFHGRLIVNVGTKTDTERIIVSAARRKQFLDWLGGE